MHYQVIHFFTDLQDSKHPYNAGDIFPRDGLKVSAGRLKELSGKNNRQKKPLIKPVEDSEAAEAAEKNIAVGEGEKKYTKTEINRMSVSDLRQLALHTGVKSADNMTGAELKEYLISLFGL